MRQDSRQSGVQSNDRNFTCASWQTWIDSYFEHLYALSMTIRVKSLASYSLSVDLSPVAQNLDQCPSSSFSLKIDQKEQSVEYSVTNSGRCNQSVVAQHE